VLASYRLTFGASLLAASHQYRVRLRWRGRWCALAFPAAYRRRAGRSAIRLPTAVAGHRRGLTASTPRKRLARRDAPSLLGTRSPSHRWRAVRLIFIGLPLSCAQCSRCSTTRHRYRGGRRQPGRASLVRPRRVLLADSGPAGAADLGLCACFLPRRPVNPDQVLSSPTPADGVGDARR